MEKTDRRSAWTSNSLLTHILPHIFFRVQLKMQCVPRFPCISSNVYIKALNTLNTEHALSFSPVPYFVFNFLPQSCSSLSGNLSWIVKVWKRHWLQEKQSLVKIAHNYTNIYIYIQYTTVELMQDIALGSNSKPVIRVVVLEIDVIETVQRRIKQKAQHKTKWSFRLNINLFSVDSR